MPQNTNQPTILFLLLAKYQQDGKYLIDFYEKNYMIHEPVRFPYVTVVHDDIYASV